MITENYRTIKDFVCPTHQHQIKQHQNKPMNLIHERVPANPLVPHPNSVFGLARLILPQFSKNRINCSSGRYHQSRGATGYVKLESETD